MLFFPLVLTGCVSVPKVALDDVAAKKIGSVAMMPIGESKNIRVTNVGPAMMLGAIGGAIQGLTDDDHSKSYAAALNAQEVKLAKPVSDALIEGLKSKGLAVELLVGQHAKLASDGKSDDYSDVKTSADVILQVWFGYTGYFSGATSDYKPWVVVHAKLLDTRTKKELYHQSFSALRKPASDAIEFVPVAGEVEYKNFDDLISHAGQSLVPLQLGHQAIVRQLLKELKLGANPQAVLTMQAGPAGNIIAATVR